MSKLKTDKILLAYLQQAANEPDDDFLHDEIYAAIECYCADDYTRGYLMRKLEVDSSNYLDPRELWEDMYEFAKRFEVAETNKLNKYSIVFYNRFACETQIFSTQAKNKHVARHIFWEKYPKTQYYDCIESIYEN